MQWVLNPIYEEYTPLVIPKSVSALCIRLRSTVQIQILPIFGLQGKGVRRKKEARTVTSKAANPPLQTNKLSITIDRSIFWLHQPHCSQHTTSFYPPPRRPFYPLPNCCSSLFSSVLFFTTLNIHFTSLRVQALAETFCLTTRRQTLLPVEKVKPRALDLLPFSPSYNYLA